jgi:hypothetical protein
MILLGLSDHPLYNGVGLLMWLIPVQVVVAVAIPIPVVVAFVAFLVLMVGLAVSYLAFAEHLTPEQRELVLTDLAFPQEVKLEQPPHPDPVPQAQRTLPAWVKRALPQPASDARARADAGTTEATPSDQSPDEANTKPGKRSPIFARRKP